MNTRSVGISDIIDRTCVVVLASFKRPERQEHKAPGYSTSLQSHFTVLKCLVIRSITVVFSCISFYEENSTLSYNYVNVT